MKGCIQYQAQPVQDFGLLGDLVIHIVDPRLQVEEAAFQLFGKPK